MSYVCTFDEIPKINLSKYLIKSSNKKFRYKENQVSRHEQVAKCGRGREVSLIRFDVYNFQIYKSPSWDSRSGQRS